MKITKIFAGIAASAVAVSAMAMSAFAVDATGADGEVCIAFASADWTAQYWLNGEEFASVGTNPVITGDGTYTVSVQANTTYEDEDTGEEVTAPGATGLAFAAVEVVNGETLFPGMVMTVDSVKVDGADVALTGTPYTSSDDGVTTRVNLYNGWVSALPDDARTVDGLAADATPTPINPDLGEWSTMEVTFTVSGAGAAATTDDAADTTTDNTAATTDKTSPDTGVEGIAVVAGVAALAAGALVVSKKRK